MAWIRAFILVFLFSVSMAGAHPDDQASKSKRGAGTDKREWNFQNCQVWNPHTQQAEKDEVVADIQKTPKKGFLSDSWIKGSLRIGSETQWKLKFPLDSSFQGRWEHVFRSNLNGEDYVEESMVYDERADEKILVIPTRKAVRRYHPGFQQFRVAMLSSTGKLVEVEISIVGGEFHTAKVIRACGGGFGLASLLGGQVEAIQGDLRKPSPQLGKIWMDRPTVTPVGREYTDKEMALMQDFILRWAQSTTP